MQENLKCTLCPRNCQANRTTILGYCKSTTTIQIGNYSLHKWEEPPISGNNGAGTIFFSHCSLNCIYCQNYELTKNHKGYTISITELAQIMLTLQKKGAHNINLVTPTHYVPDIINALTIAKNKGLTIPIIYNTSAYETIGTLKLLNNKVDIYLPDLKYYSSNISQKYSNAPNYFKISTKAIEEMYNQVGSPQFNTEGIITKGLIVRHLVLPGHIEDSKKILKYLYDTYKNNIYISIMNQYTPVRTTPYPNLCRPLTKKEYNEVIDYAYNLGIRNAFVQDGETSKESFIPIFTNSKQNKF